MGNLNKDKEGFTHVHPKEEAGCLSPFSTDISNTKIPKMYVSTTIFFKMKSPSNNIPNV